MSSQGGSGLTVVEEALVATLGTAASAAAPYVAITIGVVTLFAVLDNNRPVTVIHAPENQRNLFRENITSKVLYHPQENKSSVEFDGSLINLIPENNISIKEKGKNTIKKNTRFNTKNIRKPSIWNKIKNIEIDKIYYNPKDNVFTRTPGDFNDNSLAFHKKYIAKNGVIYRNRNNIFTVYDLGDGTYMLQNEHHRFRAAQIMGLKSIKIEKNNTI